MFAIERGGPFTPDAVNRLIKRVGERAGFLSKFTATCCATPAATPWLMRGMIRAPNPRLARASFDTAYRALQCTKCDAVPGFLALICLPAGHTLETAKASET